jgi:O-acetyl-ADP-ribose deacetylase
VRLERNGVTVAVAQGDIARQPDVDAIVNAANAALQSGGGVAGAIHRAAGHELARAGRPLAPIRPGQAVITPGFNLPNRFVIHCLGPVFGRDKPEAELLAACYRNALARAEESGVTAVAFPAISTGAFGYPLAAAAAVALKAVLEALPGLQSVKLVRFVLWSTGDLRVFEEELRGYAAESGPQA